MGCSFAIATFGCKVNQYDSQSMREALIAAGCVERPLADGPDVAVVNTCTVTAAADRKARQLIRRIARAAPDCRIVVTGCMVNRDCEQFAVLPGVWQVLSNEQKRGVASLLCGGPTDVQAGVRLCTPANPFSPGISDFAGHTRAFVKIQDGCDARCAYCIVPTVRGHERSRPMPEVLDEIHRLADRFQEIVLTGIHVGRYHDGAGADLAGLVGGALEETPVRRLRLSSIEVAEVTPELLDVAAASDRFCPHFHIPLQSGSPRVLDRMNRRTTAQEYLDALGRIRARLDRPSLTTDVIVGFPGETDEDFAATLAVCREAAFSRMHMFRYSDRPGTAAAEMSGQCRAAVVSGRLERLERLAAERALEYKRGFVGETVDVLVETSRDRSGRLRGYTSRYVRVVFNGPDELRGRIVPVAVTRAEPEALLGEPVTEKP